MSVSNKHLEDCTDSELRTELDRRQTFKIKEEYERREMAAEIVNDNRKAFSELADALGLSKLAEQLKDYEFKLSAEIKIDFTMQEDDFLEKVYGDSSNPVWKKFE
jgi:hypothetical protein